MEEIPEVLQVIEKDFIFWVVIAPSPDKVRFWSVTKTEADDKLGALAEFYRQWGSWEFATYKQTVLERTFSINYLEGT